MEEKRSRDQKAVAQRRRRSADKAARAAARYVWKARNRARLSQKELAALIGVDPSVIRNVEQACRIDDKDGGVSLGLLFEIQSATGVKLTLF